MIQGDKCRSTEISQHLWVKQKIGEACGYRREMRRTPKNRKYNYMIGCYQLKIQAVIIHILTHCRIQGLLVPFQIQYPYPVLVYNNKSLSNYVPAQSHTRGKDGN